MGSYRVWRDRRTTIRSRAGRQRYGRGLGRKHLVVLRPHFEYIIMFACMLGLDDLSPGRALTHSGEHAEDIPHMAS